MMHSRRRAARGATAMERARRYGAALRQYHGAPFGRPIDDDGLDAGGDPRHTDHHYYDAPADCPACRRSEDRAGGERFA